MVQIAKEQRLKINRKRIVNQNLSGSN